MSTKPDGGPAYPICASTGDPRDGVYCAEGMSKRERYALAAWISGPCSGSALDDYEDEPEAFAEHQACVAKLAFGYADAMIAEGEK